MSGFQQKWWCMLQGKIKQSEGTKQASKPDSDMAEVLELSYLSFNYDYYAQDSHGKNGQNVKTNE